MNAPYAIPFDIDEDFREEMEEVPFQENETASAKDTDESSDDYVQRTVTSYGGFSIDTQDSDRYKDAPFMCGNVQFLTDTLNGPGVEPKKHYVAIPSDTSTEEMSSFIATYWRMRSPKIVLSVISGVKHFKAWKSQRTKLQFQKGIIKAANTTEMWIITNGIDGGVAKMIGDAVREEKAKRASSHIQSNTLRATHIRRLKKLTVIGVVPKEVITYGTYLNGEECVSLKNEGSKPNSDQYELNSDHTHFILVEEEDKERMLFTNVRCAIEKEFENGFGRPHRFQRLFSCGSDEIDCEMSDLPRTLPVVGLLVQGSPRGVEHVLFYLRNGMPVVVLKGSGGVADLISYAYEELHERNDSDFEENFLKPELIKMINKNYPQDFKDNDLARNAFRDKILDCVNIAQEGDADQTFLTFVNMQGWDANLQDLDKYILKALLKSEKQHQSKWREQLHKHLQLTLDWNRPDLAYSEIFQRDDWTRIRVDKELFEQALLKSDREEFVTMFLEQGFQVHRYLNHKKLKLLFERAEDQEFFDTICLECALGKSVVREKPLDQDFLSDDINRLMTKLSGIRDFVQPYELSMNSVGLYVLDPAVAERKALNCLIMWAILMNKHKMAKVLWNRSDDPIALALICSNIYKELSKLCVELYLKTEMENCAQDFGQMALGVLDISFRESSFQAYSMLSKSLPDFNNKTTIEIAHGAGCLQFISHPCCQKWLTKKLLGPIIVKELEWGVFRLPDWFKILLSVFFIFPMYLWISFVPQPKKRKKRLTVEEPSGEQDLSDDELDDSSEGSDTEEANIPKSKSMIENELKKIKKKRSVGVRLRSALKKKKELKLPLWKQIQLLWTAPITKFWLTQTFYFIYLGIFCLGVLWPTCGNLYLDLVIWFWTAIILTELVRRTYIKYQKYKALSLFGHCLEIFLILLFLILYLFLRVIPHWINYADVNTAKAILSCGLIYFFYRLLGVYLPISPTLGPMLVRMTRMIKNDFVAFIRMFLIFLISGGVTIQAVLYPNYPLGVDMIKRVLTRPLFAMFLTKIDDLDGDVKCTHMYSNVSFNFCADDPRISPIQKCPYSSLAGYLIVIQYLLICKLVLVTLLFAMFALTITKVDNEAGDIWRFQRYALIVDFEERLSLPPPLTLISYFAMLLIAIQNMLRGCTMKCVGLCYCWKSKVKKPKESSKVHRIQKWKRSEDYNYWKKCAQEYVNSEDLKRSHEEMPKRQAEIIVNLQDDIRQHKKNTKRLNSRVMELERMVQSSRMYLENIYHKLDKTDVQGVPNIKGQFIHIAARQSPYPGTSKYMMSMIQKTYSKPKDQFTEIELTFVDEDIIEILRQEDERAQMTEEELAELPPLPQFNPKWNSVVTYRHGDNTREIDRRSWITLDSQPFRYKLDPVGLPQNAMGRTGIRGKGVLWRWGPNHVIKAVVTRWRQKFNPEGHSLGYLYVEGKRVLEFIAVKRDDGFESVYGLPGDTLHGLTTPYSTLCEAFLRTVFDDQEVTSRAELDQADMIQFFAQFGTHNVSTKTSFSVGSPTRSASQSLQPFLSGSRTSLRTETDSQGFSATLLYKGYLDDPRNTDNSWVEAEVWNFHYDHGDTFDLRISEDGGVKWKEVSPYVKLFGNESVIVQEAAKIHDAYH
ncbi:hypothetical protein ScPMuIL_011493 [Solemya velum]